MSDGSIFVLVYGYRIPDFFAVLDPLVTNNLIGAHLCHKVGAERACEH